MSHLAIVAIIATIPSRSELLRTRSLPSVLRQSCRPELVVVCVDGGVAAAAAAAIVLAVEEPSVVVIYNTRTQGCSGAWNCAVEHVVKWAVTTNRRLEEVAVALLDDDDEWLDDHLLVNRQLMQRYLPACVQSIRSDSS